MAGTLELGKSPPVIEWGAPERISVTGITRRSKALAHRFAQQLRPGHVVNYEKRNRTQAAIWAIEHGLAEANVRREYFHDEL
jgi:hypothetical protein